MNDTGVIDTFLEVFSRYIDTGFGLVRGDVASMAQMLVALDVTLAALFWAFGPGEEILARLVRKVLYVGFFAFVIGDFARLSQLVFQSFAGLGLKASGAAISASELLRPGHVASAGVAAVRPLLAAAGDLAGFPALFENFVQLAVILASVFVVLAAFFVLAVQLFVTLVEFKLTTLAGFILVPFGLFGRTAFLAERVLGGVMAAGVKVLVLAVVVGVGSGLFQSFVADYGGGQPTLDQALATALGALALLGLAIFSPSIAGGLTGGSPQLGAGAAAGTALGVAGLAVAGGAAARSIVGAAGAVRGARTLSRGGGGSPGSPGAGGPPARPSPGSPSGSSSGSSPGPSSGPPSGRPKAPSDPSGGASDEAPEWARKLGRRSHASSAAHLAAHTLRSGDHAGGGIAVPLREEKA